MSDNEDSPVIYDEEDEISSEYNYDESPTTPISYDEEDEINNIKSIEQLKKIDQESQKIEKKQKKFQILSFNDLIINQRDKILKISLTIWLNVFIFDFYPIGGTRHF